MQFNHVCRFQRTQLIIKRTHIFERRTMHNCRKKNAKVQKSVYFNSTSTCFLCILSHCQILKLVIKTNFFLHLHCNVKVLFCTLPTHKFDFYSSRSDIPPMHLITYVFEFISVSTYGTFCKFCFIHILTYSLA